MPDTVVTLTEITDRTGYVLAVFSDLGLAIDAARSHARQRIERCNIADEKLLGTANPPGTYEIAMNHDNLRANIFITHRPSGEVDAVQWQIRTFEVITPPLCTEPQHPQLSNFRA